MLKNIAKLEVKIGERLYHFFCDQDSPIGEIHDAITQMKGFVVNRILEVHESQKPKDEEPAPEVVD